MIIARPLDRDDLGNYCALDLSLETHAGARINSRRWRGKNSQLRDPNLKRKERAVTKYLLLYGPR